jgi:Proteasome assembly chaperone 4
LSARSDIGAAHGRLKKSLRKYDRIDTIDWYIIYTPPPRCSLKVVSMVPKIGVETKFIAPPDYSFPALALQVTRLAGSYMIWVGTTDESAEDVEKAPLHGSLCRDWACAMPPPQVCLHLTMNHKY